MTEHQTTAEHQHTSPAQYVAIGAVLVVLTAIEVSLYYLEDAIQRGLLIAALLFLAGVKFFLVAAYFMHLKDDPKIFRRWFTIGGVSAIILFTIVLVSLHFQDYRFF